ncbi:MAG: GNAT family N-acetyltransferase [Lawsonibacter sp.]|nr:GNAT family N-acetyltransferase [Lawsonibacter sp.]
MIRKGTREDIPQVAAIYDRILAQEERGQASVGWARGVYPTEQTALDSLAAGTLFVLEQDGTVAAAAKIDQNQVSEYAGAPWRYPDAPESQIMVLHTLVVDPDWNGKGLGTQFVRFYEQYALDHGCPYLRMDTNTKNMAARKLYARLGYWESGIVPCVFNGISNVQLVCLEKKLH